MKLFLLICCVLITRAYSLYFDGVDDYIEWTNETNWGDIGNLRNGGEDYSFGWTLGSDWLGSTFYEMAIFSRDVKSGLAISATPPGTAEPYGVLDWIGKQYFTGYSGSNTLDNPYNYANGDSIQFNCNTGSGLYYCDVYHNGNLMESVSMASLRTDGSLSGVVRFGYPVEANYGDYHYYNGNVTNLWFARDVYFTDGDVSLALSQSNDIELEPEWNNITSFFNLDESLTDVKGNANDGVFINTPAPTNSPTPQPTDPPTPFPTPYPTDSPTKFPTPPTLQPTLSPTTSPVEGVPFGIPFSGNETSCECFNGGYCVNAYCQCYYPYYGESCELTKDCNCTLD